MDLSNQENLQALTLHRRFDRFARLVGNSAIEKLRRSHVMIIGLGGVGSWCAESIARSGFGEISLVDFDLVCVTNTNRQLPAMVGTVGKRKVEVMADRIQKINPQAKVNIIEKFYNPDSASELLATAPNLIIDCIDNISAKCHLIAKCFETGQKLITSGGAGSRLNPLALQVKDLMDTHTDQFLEQVRKVLRTKYNFPEKGKTVGIPCVFSTEVPTEPFALDYDKGTGFKCVCPQGQNDFHSCERRNVIHGTASFVTGTFGLVMASQAVEILCQKN